MVYVNILNMINICMIHIWLLVARFKPWFCHPTTILLCDQRCKILDISQDCFTNQILAYILFLVSYSNETNEIPFLNFFQRSTQI
jgi:hypothetical protein